MSEQPTLAQAKWYAPVAIAIGVLILVSLCSVALFGSVKNGFRYSMGTRVVVAQQVAAERIVRAGSPFRHEFVLSNIDFRDYKLVGADVSCPCAVAESLPMLLPAGKDAAFNVTMMPPLSAVGKRYEATVIAFLDIPHEPIKFTLVAEKVAPASETVSQ